MNSQSYEHLKSILRSPEQAAVAQATYDRKRLADVENSKRVRPHFLPIQLTLPAAAATLPVTGSTEVLNHDVIVHGAITDAEDRNGRFYRDVEANPLVRYGQGNGLKLSIDAIAGHNVASAGLPGVYRYPEPFLLKRNQLLTLEMFQETSPGVTQVVSTVFTGERVFRANSVEASLADDERKEIQKFISRRPAPEPRYGVMLVDFDATGAASAETPKADEPLLILGFRSPNSSMSDSMVNFGFDGDNSFAKSRFPMWALISEADNGRQLYQMLKTPIYVPAQQQLLFNFFNTIDGVNFAADGNIEYLARSV